MTTATHTPWAPPTPPTSARRGRSRATKVTAAVLGAALAGGAAFAALTWWNTRGTGTATRLAASVTLDVVASLDGATGTDVVLDDGAITVGPGHVGTLAAVKTGTGPAAAFTMTTTDAYPGYVAPVSLRYLRPAGAVPLEVVGVRAVQSGTTLPLTGPDVVVPFLDSTTPCGTDVTATTAPGTEVRVLVLHTDAFTANTAYDVLVEFAPVSLAGVAAPGSSYYTTPGTNPYAASCAYPTSTVAP